MKPVSKNNESTQGSDFTWEFPMRRLYFVLITALTILSLFGFSLQTDNTSANSWRVTAEIKVTSLTLILLFLGWVPLLLPWLTRISPRLQQFFIGLRAGGIEEIEAGILRIKLNSGSGIAQAATVYEGEVLNPSKTVSPETNIAQNVENMYRETTAAIEKSGKLSSQDAMDRIHQLSDYYNRLRDTMPSSSTRTQLMTNIASIMFSLMSSVDVFPVQQSINSPDGGQRLAAYKYLESKPDLNYLDPLLSRAMGILEVPFGQFHALLSLRRMISSGPVTPDQKDRVTQMLNWTAGLPYMGSDRRALMANINRLLQQ